MRRLLLALFLFSASTSDGADCPSPPTKPTRGVPCTDIQSGNTINRATVHSTDQGGSTKMLNDYSKSDAFNSDKSYYLIRADGGAWYIYQTSDHSVVRGPVTFLGGENDAEWDATDPNKLYYFDNNGGLVMKSYSVSGNTSATVKDFTTTVQGLFGGTAARLTTGDEGRPSADSRYWGWMVKTSAFGMLGLLVWDKQTDSVVGSLVYPGGTSAPNWVGMTPSGAFLIVAGGTEIVGGAQVLGRAYKRDFSDWTWTTCWGQHEDVLRGQNGNDYYVSAQVAGCDGDGLFYYVELGDEGGVGPDWVSQNYATRHKLAYGVYVGGGYNGFHINGTAYDLPGTFLVSTSDCQYSNCPNTYSDRLTRYNIDGTAPVVIARSYNTYVNYWTEVFGATSRDGSKIIWGSNWCASGCTSDVDAYIVDVATTFSITTTTLPNGTNGQTYQQDVQTSGGTQPVTACITSAGALPTGASWSVQGSACRLTDASIETGTYNFTLQATDSNSNTDTQAFTLSVVAALQIDTTSPMADGTQGAGYSPTLTCSGGTPPRTFSCCQAGSLPTGLSLASDGSFTGTLSQTGTFNFTARCTDDVAATADKALQVTVNAAGGIALDPVEITVTDTVVVIRIGAAGLSASSTCEAILLDSGGAELETATSAAGNARRTLSFTGLTAATAYSVIATCTGATPDLTPHPFVTLAAATGGARTVPLQFGAPSSLLVGAARLTVEYDDNAALSTPATSQNTSCGSGCTVNLSLGAGLWYYRWIWQTAADATLATSAIQALPIP